MKNSNFLHTGVLYIASVEFRTYKDSGNSVVQIYLSEQPNCSISTGIRRKNRRTGEVKTHFINTRMALDTGKIAMFVPKGDPKEFLASMAEMSFDGKNPSTGDLWGIVGMPFFGAKVNGVQLKSASNPINKQPVYGVEFLNWDEDYQFRTEEKFDEVHPNYIINLEDTYLKAKKPTFIERFEKYCSAVKTNRENNGVKTNGRDLLSTSKKTIISREEFVELKKLSAVKLKEFCQNSSIKWEGTKAKTQTMIYNTYVKPYMA
jgi:hypothetical protein